MDGHRRYAEDPEPSWYAGRTTPETTGSHAAPAPGGSSWDSGVHERPSGAFRLPEQRPAAYPSPDPVTSTGSHATSPADSGVLRVPVRGPEYPAVRPAGSTPAPPAYNAPPAPPAYNAPPAPAAYTPPPATTPAYTPPSAYATTTAYTPPSGATPAYTSPATSTTAPAPAATTAPVEPAAGYNDPTSMVPLAVNRPTGAPEAVYNSRRPLSTVLFAAATVVLLVPAVLLLVQATFVDDPTARGVVPAVLLVLGLPLTGTGLASLAAGGKAGGRDAWLRPPVAYLPVGLMLLLAAGLGVA
ncbi:hypothetical protein [Actinoplanes sp. RD1]|uniref:hypothetical protein n=1 Tax=Actinoplanes sp. RD1 TaxID=3064538 RepID=UPI0027415E67|nr:hypothetical protein [Actinoplanes sp. RD1]